VEPMKYSGTITPEHVYRQQRIIQDWTYWHQAMDALTAQNTGTWSSTQSLIARGMTMRSHMMYIWVQCCCSPQQTAFDAFMPEFKTMVELGERVLFESDVLSSFQTEATVIPSLEFIAYKCRSPVLRRRALTCLRSAKWREGAFDSYQGYRRCHRIMEIEETGLWEHVAPAVPLGLSNEILPAESARVHTCTHSAWMSDSKRHHLRVVTIPNGNPEDAAVLDVSFPVCGELPSLESRNNMEAEGVVTSAWRDDIKRVLNGRPQIRIDKSAGNKQDLSADPPLDGHVGDI
jgi:hypothetical protein